MYNLANCINKMEVSDDPAKRKGERGGEEREREEIVKCYCVHVIL